jgi:hypothetical protein
MPRGQLRAMLSRLMLRDINVPPYGRDDSGLSETGMLPKRLVFLKATDMPRPSHFRRSALSQICRMAIAPGKSFGALST